ncbi:MAG: SDR family oxidoreductase, partial [Tannerella sp.]|nr:SDR family oxidoreductase [Tannerella sp.]
MEKNAIITGAGRHKGIGAQVCRALARKGINIYFTTFDEYDCTVGGIKSSEYQQTLEECRAFGVKAYYAAFDLRNQKDVTALFDDAINKLGTVDILINCLCYHKFDSFNSISEPQIEINLDVNIKSVFLLCQEFYRRYTGNSGRIVNFSSTQNLEPLPTEIAYAISKAVAPVVVSTLAPIMASKGITINAVNPGPTDTGYMNDSDINYYCKYNQFGRLGTPEDAANIVCFLVSDEGGWITGQTINSEGGLFRG